MESLYILLIIEQTLKSAFTKITTCIPSKNRSFYIWDSLE
jgi:hypothetical protein